MCLQLPLIMRCLRLGVYWGTVLRTFNNVEIVHILLVLLEVVSFVVLWLYFDEYDICHSVFGRFQAHDSWIHKAVTYHM